ncbi:MAG: hypothetical protein M1827_007220 [Pycnora praestabilis]|nr:MAG: hypothetical protein M1827_007220 [Pycnora praestabilis]
MDDDYGIVRWIMDTRKVWTQESVKSFYAEATRALKLLKLHEQNAVYRYIHAKDAKMSLGSILLKHLAISKACNVPWSEIELSQDSFRKPCYIPKDPSGSGVQFNVSHQAGLVALVRSHSVSVGVDIVCVGERDDYRSIERAHGFDNWVDIFGEVFSPREIEDMKYQVYGIHLDDGTYIPDDELGGLRRHSFPNTEVKVKRRNGEIVTFDSRIIVEAKIRRFYAFWCLKEAYIKMTGEALMADWLRDLEFRNVRPPAPAMNDEEPQRGSGWGEIIRDVETWFKGNRVTDVRIELQAYRQEFMIATAVRIDSVKTRNSSNGTTDFPDFVELDLEKDLYPRAEQN